MRLWVVASCWSTVAALSSPLTYRHCPVLQAQRRNPHISACDGNRKQLGTPPAALIGYGFLASQLTAPLLVGLTRLGLIQPPPFNTFTAIANNAMVEAVESGEINKLTATVYGQGKWAELIQHYYTSGATTEFLTAADGVCAQHPAWCAGISIPLVGGLVPPAL